MNLTDARSTPRRIAFALGALLLAAACGDPYATKASNENAVQALSVHALSGTPLAYATGLNLTAKATTKVDGNFSFDLAFDINSRGEIVYFPVRLVASNPSGDRQIGILKPGGNFDGITEAPRTGYNVDSVTVAQVGQPIIVQGAVSACSGTLTPYLYAKMVVDSVHLADRVLFGRALINLNCGFRSLSAGLPKF
jgi:hypothetical protein